MAQPESIPSIGKAFAAPILHQRKRRDHWNDIADESKRYHWTDAYHDRLKMIYRHLIAPGQRVLELGCGQGDLLAGVHPSLGVGLDFSHTMIQRARARHPHLCFIQADALWLCFRQTFDVIILSDLVNDLWDVQSLLGQLNTLAQRHTRLIINVYSRLWELPLKLTRRFGLARPELDQNWLTVEDLRGMLYLADFEVLRSWREILFPFRIRWLSDLANRLLAKLWPLQYLDLTNFIIARPVAKTPLPESSPSVSVVVPVRNEAGNIPQIFQRMPELGRSTEIVFVEGHSHDGSYDAIVKASAEHPRQRCQILRQTGRGKGDAVRMGFDRARGDVLVILDADLTVAPEDLPRFIEALVMNKADVSNGVRLVYPIPQQAMRFLNLVGNKFFSMAFTWLLGQDIKDTLCGTKALWKSDYQRIAANRSYFGDFDPFGDFDLLFGAARLTLKIMDLPVRYHPRAYGRTSIQRWRHGWLLLRMVLFALRRIKFV